MTQTPWLDKLLHKNDLAAMLKPQRGSPILKVTADLIQERQKRVNSNVGERKKKTECDLLDRFLEIQSANPSIPPWYELAETKMPPIAP
jgi:hypothetical protein